MNKLSLRKIGWELQKTILEFLPKALRNHLIRQSIRLPEEIPQTLKFHLAQSQSDLEQAFRVLHDCYIQQGYMEKSECGMRVVPQFALPTTATLVAKQKNEVAGTLSIIGNSAMGLPMEHAFNISHVKNQGGRVAEISALAIKKGFRRTHGGAVFFPLLKLMYEFCVNEMSVRHLLIVIDPKTEYFYNALLHFERVPGTGVVNYMGAPAIAMHLDLAHAQAKFAETYGHRPNSGNLSKFFVETKLANLLRPQMPYFIKSHPVVTPKIFAKLFVKKAKVLKFMTGVELREFKMALTDSPLQSFIDGYRMQEVRRDARYEVSMPARLITDLNLSQVTVRQVSQSGLCVESHNETGYFSDRAIVRVEVGPHIYAKLVIKKVWDQDQVAGYKIVSHDAAWRSLFSYLHNTHQFRTQIESIAV